MLQPAVAQTAWVGAHSTDPDHAELRHLTASRSAGTILLAMRFGGRKKAQDEQAPGTFALVTLNEPIMPTDRQERYEELLEATLARTPNRGQVTGGGTQQRASGEIAHADIELDLVGDIAEASHHVIKVLEHLGAPVGSHLVVDGAEPIDFGRTRGIGVYLNGTDLPDEVYETSDVNDLVAALENAVEGLGPMPHHSHWQGPTETAMYFYAEDRDELRRRLTAEAEKHPLAQGCRIVDLPDSLQD